MNEINGLPIAFFVIGGGIIIVLVSWLLMRFGKIIARVFLVGAVVIIGGVLAVAAVGQSAANFQQSRATVEVAQAAQAATTGLSLTALAAVSCIGGMGTLLFVAVGAIGLLWYRAQQAEHRQAQQPAQLPRQRVQPALPYDFEPVVYIDEDVPAQGVGGIVNWADWV